MKCIIIDDEPIAREIICDHISKIDDLELIAEFKKALSFGKQTDFLVFMNIMSDVTPSELADQIASTLDIKGSERQEILELFDIKARLARVLEFLSNKILLSERS